MGIENPQDIFLSPMEVNSLFRRYLNDDFVAAFLLSSLPLYWDAIWYESLYAVLPTLFFLFAS